MDQDRPDKSVWLDPFSEWIRASTEFWGSVHKLRHPLFEPPPISTRSDQTSKKDQAEDFRERTSDIWDPVFSMMAQLMNAAEISKIISALPEMVLKMAQTGWDGYFHLQKEGAGKTPKTADQTGSNGSGNINNSASKIVADLYKKELRDFFAIPQMDLANPYQQRINRVMNKYNLLQVAAAELLRLLAVPVEKSFQAVQEKIGGLADKKDCPEHSKKYYGMWIEILEDHYATMLKSPDYTRTLSDTLNAMGEYVEAKNQVFEDVLQGLPIATRKEVDELSKQVYLLRKRVKELTKRQTKR